MTTALESAPLDPLSPYVPRLVVDWLRTTPDARHRSVDGSMAFVDISGFTQMTERLARLGKVGAEEMSDTLNATFASLLAVAYEDGASLVKWGGDAVLLLFDGSDHAAHASRAAHRMQKRMREVGRLQTAAGNVTLRMSVGIHSGRFDFFLVGDADHHRELLVCGPAATTTAMMEKVADAGQVVISPQTMALLDPVVVGARKGDGFLLRRSPDLPMTPAPTSRDTTGLNLAMVIPPRIRDRVLASTGVAEHRTVTVAFVEFSGTDAVMQVSGVDALTDALDACIRHIQEACAAHDVTFFETDINADGGKVMLTAGAPVTAEHDEERMLLTARSIVDRVGVLPVRIGVNRGGVFSGDFGPPFRRTFSIKGDAVNLAARVMGKAAAGQVLATDAVLDRSPTAFDIESLSPFMVKGKRQPVEASSVGRVAGRRSDATGDQPLIGREAEMAVLGEALDRARGGDGVAVALTGEPGIGKSRLVAEVLALASDIESFVVVSGEYASSTPYAAARLLIREVLDVAVGDGAESVHRLLVDRLAAAAPQLLPWVPAMGPLLDLRIPDTAQTAAIDPRFRKARLEDVTHQVLAVLRPDPSVIVLDDVHLMDEASADLMERLLLDIENRPWLVLLTRRELDSGLVPVASRTMTLLAPAPLDAAAAMSLIAGDGDDDPLPPHVMEALASRAQGNPFFLQSLATAARQSAEPEALPDTLESLLNSQIDRLPPNERTVLRYAAVLGVSFAERDLRALLVDQPIPSDHLTMQRLLQFVEADGHGRFRFRHALLRDAAYAGLPVRRRKVLHGRVADNLVSEAVDAEELDELSELLSLHFFEADRMSQAWAFSRVAARRAADKYAFPAVAEFLTRAVRASGSNEYDGDGELAVVYEDLGDAHLHVGSLDDSRQAYRASRRLRQEPLKICDLLRKEALVEQRLDRIPMALRTLTRAMNLLDDDEEQGAAAERARLNCAYARCRELQGRYREAVRWGSRAEQMARAAGDRRALAEAYEALHSASSMAGFDQPEPYGELALSLFDELGDREAVSRALNNLGVHAWFEGRGQEALEMFERSRDAAAAAGDTLGAAATAHNIGDVLLRLGRLDEAEAVLRPLRATFRALGSEGNYASTVRWLGLAAVRDGRLDEARTLIEQSRAQFVALGLAAEVAETDSVVVEELLAHGEPGQAESLARDALQRAVALDAGYLVPTLLRLRAVALLELGQAADAEAALREALVVTKDEGAADRGFILADLARATAVSDPAASRQYATTSRAALADLGYVGDA